MRNYFKLTRFISDGPHQEIDASRIGHHVDLVLVHHDVGRIVHFVQGAVVLLVLQLGLSDQEQSFHKFLDVFGERGGKVWNEQEY